MPIGFGVLCVFFLAVAARMALHLPIAFGHKREVTALCHALTDALRTNDLEKAIALSAEGEPGRNLLEQEEQRTRRPEAGQEPAANAEERVSLREFLDAVKEELAGQGVVWKNIHALAFGGIEAKMLDPQRMRKPAVAITGELYFLSGAKIYAIEFTARRCKGDFVITDFWRCGVTDAEAATLQQYSQNRFAPLLSEQKTADHPVTLSKTRHLFLSL